MVELRNGFLYLAGQKGDENQTQGIMMKVRPQETIPLWCGSIIQMGTLTFIIDRYNIGVVAEMGFRPTMEDAYIVNQDIKIDSHLKATLLCVIDGHGGDWCTNFLKSRLNQELS
eukprot:CAMPEP_0176358748 /NCGR_PEP_ID=MMETSP0126-20121128/15805_1 /TAXON_ID=141414 ORGANISM="Strombidinopsis acuminatum, Strain SPMC142" /NCGR_SAMPLE_ID=MMETSP0126 /ASSEMBLY_ACC=CAM_ASM_000229 /LENGTH=113 /DNA_ID=CAMNT_0017713109 /DNA_START=208 /DNA_END=549 /DNA_ORIENTATION=-